MSEFTNPKRLTNLGKRVQKAKSLKEIFEEGDKGNLENVIFENFGMSKKQKNTEFILYQRDTDKKPNSKGLSKQNKFVKGLLNGYIDELKNDDLIMETTPKSNNKKNKESLKLKNQKTMKNEKSNLFSHSIKIPDNENSFHTFFTENENRNKKVKENDSKKKKTKKEFDLNLSTSEPIFKDEINVINCRETEQKITLKSEKAILENPESPIMHTHRSKKSHKSKISRSKSKKSFKSARSSMSKIEFDIFENSRKLKRVQKICDSMSDDEEEQEINVDAYSNFIIHPDSNFKIYWDLMTIIITFYFVIFSPYFIAFETKKIGFIYVELLFEIIYVVDLMLNFLIPYQTYEEKLVMNHKFIVRHYLKGWFLPDVLSSFPGNTLFNFHSKLFGNQNLIFFSVVRLFKFSKLFKLMMGNDNSFLKSSEINILEEININSGIRRIFKSAFVFILISHVLSCVWIYFGSLTNVNWLTNININNMNQIDIYIASLYFIWTTIFTIGYGDILSISIPERFYNIFLMSVGVLIYSFGVTSLSSLVTRYDSMTQRFYRNLEILEDIRKKCPELDSGLYEKLVKFVKFDYKFNKASNFAFVAELPSRTRNSLLYRVYKKMISNYSFFKYSNRFNSDDFNSRIVLSMRPIRLYKGEMIMREGELIQEMILVSQGVVTAELGKEYNKAKIFDLRKNDHFGDLLILSNSKCPMNLKVKSKICEAYIIKKSDLIQIERDFPLIFKQISRVSSENYKRYQKLIEEIKQDFNEIKNSREGEYSISKKKSNLPSLFENYENEHNNDIDFEEKKEFMKRIKMNSKNVSRKKSESIAQKAIEEEEGDKSEKNILYLNSHQSEIEIHQKEISDPLARNMSKHETSKFEVKSKILPSQRNQFSSKSQIQINNLGKINLNFFMNNNQTVRKSFFSKAINNSIIRRNEFEISRSEMITIKGNSKKTILKCSCEKSLKNKNSNFLEKVLSEKFVSNFSSCDSQEEYKLTTKIRKNIKSYENIHSSRSVGTKSMKVRKRKSMVYIKNNYLEEENKISLFSKKSMIIAKTKQREIINDLEEYVEINKRAEKNPTLFIKNELGKIGEKIQMNKMNQMLKKLDIVMAGLKSTYVK